MILRHLLSSGAKFRKAVLLLQPCLRLWLAWGSSSRVIPKELLPPNTLMGLWLPPQGWPHLGRYPSPAAPGFAGVAQVRGASGGTGGLWVPLRQLCVVRPWEVGSRGWAKPGKAALPQNGEIKVCACALGASVPLSKPLNKCWTVPLPRFPLSVTFWCQKGSGRERCISAANICSHLCGGQPNSCPQMVAEREVHQRGRVVRWPERCGGELGAAGLGTASTPSCQQRSLSFLPLPSSGSLHYSKGKELASCGRGHYFRRAQVISNSYAL